MEPYQYENPTSKGYKKISLTGKEHDFILPNQPRKWYNKYVYYYKDGGLHVHKFTTIQAKIVIVLLFPASVLMVGAPEAYRGLKRDLFQKKYGSYVDDYRYHSRMTDEQLAILTRKV